MNGRESPDARTPDRGADSAAAAYARAGHEFQAGRVGEAEALLRETIRLDPGHADAYNRLGFLCARRGDGAGALEFLRKASALQPDSAEIASNLGSAELKFGDAEAAAAALEHAIALNAALPQTHYNLGLVYQKLDRHDRAVSCLEKALALRPTLAEALLALGESLRQLRRNDEAVAVFERLVALMPKAARARLLLARALKAGDRLEEAAAAVREALTLEPNNAAAHDLYATCLISLEREDEAIASAREALRKNPADIHAHNLIAACFWIQKRNDEAGAAARDALRIDPDDVFAQAILAAHHFIAGRMGEAETAARRVIALDPAFAQGHVILGSIMASWGRSAEARACFENALDLDPDSPEAIYELVHASTSHATAGFAAHIEELLTARLRPDRKAVLHFSLGQICDRLGDYPRAFENYAAANELAGRKSSFDAAKWTDSIDRLIETFSPDFFSGRAGFGSESRRPVFIVGMPRSGTTLVEQILASHPEIAGGGELPALPELINGLPRRIHSSRQYPEAVRDMTRKSARALAGDYLAALDAVDPDSARVTDKLPQNFLGLGHIALVLPQAAIIHCRRNPLDTCLSCFFTNFIHDLSFTHRLEDLGAYYRGYRRLMDHWRKVLPVPMLEVDYEELVENPEDVSRRLVAHCGLEWDGRCLQFHETERAVGTASVWQVRQPIYASSLARWRNYEPYLKPLLEALKR